MFPYSSTIKVIRQICIKKTKISQKLINKYFKICKMFELSSDRKSIEKSLRLNFDTIFSGIVENLVSCDENLLQASFIH